VRAIKKSEGVLAKLKQEMEFRDYIDPLAEVIRKYPRSGGQGPKGFHLLRKGKNWEGPLQPYLNPQKMMWWLGMSFQQTSIHLKNGIMLCSLVGMIPRFVFDLLLAKSSLKHLDQATPLPLFFGIDYCCYSSAPDSYSDSACHPACKGWSAESSADVANALFYFAPSSTPFWSIDCLTRSQLRAQPRKSEDSIHIRPYLALRFMH